MRLTRDRVRDFGVAIADIDAIEPRETVDVFATLGVADADAAPRFDDRRRAETAFGEVLQMRERVQDRRAVHGGDVGVRTHEAAPFLT